MRFVIVTGVSGAGTVSYTHLDLYKRQIHDQVGEVAPSFPESYKVTVCEICCKEKQNQKRNWNSKFCHNGIFAYFVIIHKRHLAYSLSEYHFCYKFV